MLLLFKNSVSFRNALLDKKVMQLVAVYDLYAFFFHGKTKDGNCHTAKYEIQISLN